MSALTQWLDRTCYPEFQPNWDDLIFRRRILDRLTSESVMLDLGAGAGILKQMDFRGLARKVCGVDIDPRVLQNPMLDEARVAEGGVIPYQDSCFDVAIANNVLEHLGSPLDVLKEVARVVKPSGVFLFKTPNKWHYVATIARLTPHRFHELVTTWKGRAAHDTFPTRYRANSKSAIFRLALACGLVVDRLEYLEGRPEYLRMNVITYLAGTAYERLVNATELLAPFRVVILGSLRKP